MLAAGDRNIADKMMRLFIIQAISSFVTRDYETGLHYLNEIKAHFAQNQSTMNSTLKGLAKEIIQSLDLLTPGASATSYADINTGSATTGSSTQEVFHTPEQELSSMMREQQSSHEVTPQQETPEKSSSNDDLFAKLGKLSLSDDSPKGVLGKIRRKRSSAKNEKEDLERIKEELKDPEKIALYQVMLERKKRKGKLSKKEEELLDFLNERKQKLDEKENPLLGIKRKRRRISSDDVWED